MLIQLFQNDVCTVQKLLPEAMGFFASVCSPPWSLFRVFFKPVLDTLAQYPKKVFEDAPSPWRKFSLQCHIDEWHLFAYRDHDLSHACPRLPSAATGEECSQPTVIVSGYMSFILIWVAELACK
jgi:hypothetical protein